MELKSIMSMGKVIIKEITFFILGPIIIMGVAGIVDLLRDQPIDWGERLFYSILTVIAMRIIFLWIAVIENREN
jgi:hypothetical protein